MKTNTSRIARATAPALLIALTALSAPADTIDASAFSQSFGIQFPGYAGSSTLTDFPVLVTLSAATGFQYAKAAAGGDDLRFALEDGTLLSHEIDTWDANGTSLVWVKIPSFSSATKIKAYYGCSGIPPAVSAGDVWSNGFVGVWHMDDDGASQGNAVDGGAALDEWESGVKRDSANIALSLDGAIGKGAQFGASQKGALSSKDSSLSLQLRESFTVEIWAWQDDHKPSEATAAPFLYREMKSDYGSSLFRINEGNVASGNAGKVVSSGSFTTSGSKAWWPSSGTPLPARAAWNHFAFSFSPSGGTSLLNGAVATTTAENHGTVIEDAGAARQLFVGNSTSSATDSWPGVIDELRISSVSRSVDWVKATHDCVTDDDFYVFVFDTSWDDYAKKFDVTFTGVQEGVTLGSFPALVRISENGIPGFDYGDCLLAGRDLRFADADGNLLASEVDTWDTNGESLVWVNVPSLTSTTKITGYYGCVRPHAVASSDVWTNGYSAVWHLGESASPLHESSGNAMSFEEGVLAPAYAVAGAVGKAVDFSGYNGSNSSRLVAADADSLDGFEDFTVEFWTKQDAYNGNLAGVLNKRNGYANEEAWFTYQEGGTPKFVFGPDATAKRVSAGAASKPTPGEWIHQAFIRDMSSGYVAWYYNGSLNNGATSSDPKAKQPVWAGTAPLYLGGGASQYSFPGSIDEVRISTVVRSVEWLKASHDTVMESAFATYGPARENKKGMIIFFR